LSINSGAKEVLGVFGFRRLSNNLLAYFYAFLDFYNRNGFIWGVEPGNPPKYTHHFKFV